ncbi:MAG: putative LPS assembly protein LptD, partial [Pseudomonadota bacterium]
MFAALFLALGAALSVTTQPADETPSEDDAVLTAERIYREDGEGPLIAVGDVRATQDGQFLRADKVIYDVEKNTLIAEGNVAIREESGQIYFADRAVLSSDLKNGIVEALATEFLPQGSLAAATMLRRESGRNELRRATYSLCPVCDEGFRRGRPIWQLKARKVNQIEEKQVLRFRHAFVEVLGIPTVYIPWIEVPDPTVKRKSGFLAPQAGRSTRTGADIETPYYIAISDHHDLTLSPRYMSNLGTMIRGEWRRNTWNSRAVVQGGFIQPTNDLAQEPGDPDEFR